MNINGKDKKAQVRELHVQVCRLADECLKDEGEICCECPLDLRRQLRELVDLLVHASECDKSSSSSSSSSSQLCLCEYPNCWKGKGLNRHAFMCTRSVCQLCKSMLRLVKFHAGACKQSNCRVPHCMKIKEHNVKRVQRRKRRLRRKEVRLIRLRKQLHVMRMSSRGQEEIRALEGKIRAEVEKISMLKIKIGEKELGYELKMVQLEERLQRWKQVKQRRRLKQVENQLNAMNIN